MTTDQSARSIEPIVSRFVATELVYEQERQEVGSEEPLLGGLLDSLAILNLVEFVEEQFGIRVSDDELLPENFATVRAVASLISEKLAAGQSG